MEASPTSNQYGLRGSVAGSRMLMIQPDAVLCKLCARGSDDAFDVLHARYRQQVFAFVFHLLNRRDGIDDAEDLTQDVFSKAFASIRSKNSEGSFKHWLFAIARNTTFDHIRARKPQGVPLEETGDSRPELANVVSIASQVETRAELAWLVATVSDLPERQREALVMRELAGMSHAEIAGELDTSVDATKQLIKRGRASVGESAEQNGYRSRNLGKDLAMAAPVVPLAATGLGVTASGASAAVGFGGLAIGTKIAAVTMTAVVIGSGGVAVKHVESSNAADHGHSASNSAADKSATSNTEVGFLATGAGVLNADGATAGAGKSDHSLDNPAGRPRGKSAAAHARRDARKRAKAKAKAKAKAHEKAAGQTNVNSNSGGNAQAGSGNSQSSGKSGGSSGGAQNTAASETPNPSESADPPASSGGGNSNAGGNAGGNGSGKK